MSQSAALHGSARGVVFAALSAMCIAAFAANDESVRAPRVKPGDCWSYRAVGINNRGPIIEYEECVTFVDRGKNVILAVVRVKDDAREIDTSYTTYWWPRTTVNGTIITYPKGQEPLKWPLRIGDTASHWHEFRRALLGPNTGKTTYNTKVVGWEEVTVPAGKFRALKIEDHGSVERYDVKQAFPVLRVFWYVPEVNRYVKYWFQNPDGRRGMEMTGYRLNR